MSDVYISMSWWNCLKFIDQFALQHIADRPGEYMSRKGPVTDVRLLGGFEINNLGWCT